LLLLFFYSHQKLKIIIIRAEGYFRSDDHDERSSLMVEESEGSDGSDDNGDVELTSLSSTTPLHNRRKLGRNHGYHSRNMAAGSSVELMGGGSQSPLVGADHIGFSPTISHDISGGGGGGSEIFDDIESGSVQMMKIPARTSHRTNRRADQAAEDTFNLKGNPTSHSTFHIDNQNQALI
jgi:hypothetical protein